MKIVCGSCGAKYSIADEKVQGKVFKIRCKKCSNVIVVKGNEDGDETVSGGAGQSQAAEWYVVIDGEQAGPVTPNEIEGYFASGRITAESFAWRDGLADWVPLSQLDDFAHLTQQAGPDEATQISDDYSHYQNRVNNEEADETSVMSAPQSSFGGGGGFSSFDSGDSDDGGFSGFSDFGSSSAPAASDDYGFAAAGGSDSGGGLFSSFDAPSGGGAEIQSAGGGGGMFASFDSGSNNDDFLGLSSNDPMPTRAKSTAGGGGAAAGGAVGNDLVGKRNENSVLFSLSSLDSVAGVGGGKSSSSAPAPKADEPVTDGSGLIDIRALASAHKTMKSSGPSLDDGPTVDPFVAGTMAMPALMPMGSHRSNKPLIIGGIVGGVALLAVVGTLIFVVLNKNDQPQEKIIEKVIIEKQIVQQGSSGDDAKAAAEAAEAEKQALAAANAPSDEPSGDDSKKSATSRKTNTGSTAKASGTEEAPKVEEAPKEVAAKSEPKGDNIDRLLDQIDKGEEKKSTSKPKEKDTSSSSTSGLKDKLDKSDVLNTIKANTGRINTCYKSQNANNLSGTMKVKFFIQGSGSVKNVEIASGEFAGTDVGRCVQKAVEGMRFPATSAKDAVPVTYPFKLQ